MFIDTTLHFHIDTIKRLLKGCRLSGWSKNYLLSRLLTIIAGEMTARPVAWSRIRYQNRDLKGNWCCMHVSLSPAEYELLLDLRKVYKMSGSRIIAMALDKYFNILLDSLDRCPDNNRFSCYVFSRFIKDGIICWAQYWGLPGKPESFPDLPLQIRNQVPVRRS